MSSCGSALNYSPGNFWLLRLPLPGISADELAPKAFRSADDDTESAAAARSADDDAESAAAARSADDDAESAAAARSADDDAESAAAARTQHWHDVEGHRAARNDPQEAGENRPVLPSAVHDQRSRRP